MADFSHLDQHGQGQMVDTSGKTASTREATVTGRVQICAPCLQSLNAPMIEEISVTAKIAGIQAAKQTAQLIPYCHTLLLHKVNVDIKLNKDERFFEIIAFCKTQGVTGVEMEAFAAATIAGLTIYDMIKAVDPSAQLGPFSLVEKKGGKSGHWRSMS